MRTSGGPADALPARSWWGVFTWLVVGLALLVLATIVVWPIQMLAWGFDFGAYYAAAQRLLATGSPYLLTTISGPFHPGPAGLYLYSPVVAPLFVPFTALSLAAGVQVWLVLRIGLLALTCALLPVKRDIRLLVFGVAVLSYPVLRDLALGNVSLVVTFLAVVAWHFIDRPASGIVVAASAFIRPQMALLALWYFVRRRYRIVAVIVGAALLIAVASLPIVGLHGWFDYLAVLRNMTDVTGADRNSDLGSAALLIGLPETVATVLLFSGYTVAIVALVLSMRRDRDVSFVVTVMATLLLSPLMWDHYLTHLILPAALVAQRGHRSAALLPLLGWAPGVLLPLVAMAGLLLPFLARPSGPPAGSQVQSLSGRLRVSTA